MKLYDSGVYLVNGKEIMTDATEVQQKTGKAVTKEQAAENTIAYGILKKHNTSGNMDKLQVRFDKLTSHYICRNHSDRKSIWLRAFSNAIRPDKLP